MSALMQRKTVKRSFEKILFLTNWFSGRLIVSTTVTHYTYLGHGHTDTESRTMQVKGSRREWELNSIS